MTETSTGAEYISEAHVRHIMRYVQAREWIKHTSMVVDAACGTGYGSKLLAKAGHMVTGFDFDDAALDAARLNANRYCEFFKTDLLAPHYKPTPQVVVSIETLEHFSKEDGIILLNEFASWLTWNGVLIISTPYCTHSGPSPITKQHLWEYSLTDFEQALVAAGFEIELMKLDRHEGKAGRLGYAMAKCRKV